MKKLYFFFSLLFILILSLPGWAFQIKGKVTDIETGEPMAGANIFVKNTNSGTAASADGLFSFSYNANQKFTLIISFMGYKKIEMELSPTSDLSNLTIKMEPDLFRADEIVVTGIASKTSKAVAEVAVSRVSGSELTEMNSYQDVSQMLSSKVAGVKIEPVTGNVGGGFRFNMRSGGGINGNEQPLIIVDGVRIDNSEVGVWDPVNGSLLSVGGQGVSTLSDLNPEDIESIEVLKGPAGASSYGTNGSNGVVLISTRRGNFVPGKSKG
ncbi:carboxypeptidase-like regulatory domain-containing protein, partial [candidate division KSB1 bacterium]|nr:carboxypeptidase-like regulatory domain-containing protein [candidate division KSB1 bacterium]